MRTLQLAEESDPAIAREVARYVDVYFPAYRDKHLLVEGGIADQPARYLAIIGAIRDVDARVQRKLAQVASADHDNAGG